MKTLLTVLASIAFVPSLTNATDVPKVREPMIDKESHVEESSLDEAEFKLNTLKKQLDDATFAGTQKRLAIAQAKETNPQDPKIQTLDQEAKDIIAKKTELRAEIKALEARIEHLHETGGHERGSQGANLRQILKGIQDKVGPEKGPICLLLLNNTVKSLDEGEVQNAAKSASGYFAKAFGQPTKLYGKSVEEKKKNKILCGKFVHAIGSDFKLAHWGNVAEALAVPYKVFGQKLTIDEYMGLSEDERFKHIREVEGDQMIQIPRAMREADFKRFQEYNKTAKEKLPFTIGSYGLAGEDISPAREEEEVRSALASVVKKIHEVPENSPEHGSLLLKKRNLERLLQSTGGKSGGREKGVHFGKN